MTSTIRAVLDTNVVLSGLLWRGKPLALIEAAAEGHIDAFTTQWLIDELTQSLSKPRLARQVATTGFPVSVHVANYLTIATLIGVDPNPAPVARDRDDDHVIAAALAAKAALVVTGDADLLVLKQFGGCHFVTVAECLEIVRASTARSADHPSR